MITKNLLLLKSYVIEQLFNNSTRSREQQLVFYTLDLLEGFWNNIVIDCSLVMLSDHRQISQL